MFDNVLGAPSTARTLVLHRSTAVAENLQR
jgi:hypothetical protein